VNFCRGKSLSLNRARQLTQVVDTAAWNAKARRVLGDFHLVERSSQLDWHRTPIHEHRSAACV
jgi:hypothetical protein